MTARCAIARRFDKRNSLSPSRRLILNREGRQRVRDASNGFQRLFIFYYIIISRRNEKLEIFHFIRTFL